LAEDAWVAIWSTYLAARPDDFPLITNPGIEKFRNWILVTAMSNGLGWTFVRLKAISNWLRYYAIGGIGLPPDVPSGTYGAKRTYITFPWLTEKFPWLPLFIKEFRKHKGTYRPKRQQANNLGQIAKFGRGLPAFSTDAIVEEKINDHKRSLFGFSNLSSDYLAFFSEGFSKWLKYQPLGNPRNEAHFSVSQSASWASSVKDGGKMNDVRTAILLLKKPIRFFINKESIIDFNKFGGLRYDRLGFPVLYTQEDPPFLLTPKTPAWRVLWQSEWLTGEFFEETYNPSFEGMEVEGLDLPKGSSALSPFILWWALRAHGVETLTGTDWNYLADRPGSTIRFMESFERTDSLGRVWKYPSREELWYVKVTCQPEQGFKNRIVTVSRTETIVLSHLLRSYVYSLLEGARRSTASSHWSTWHWCRYAPSSGWTSKRRPYVCSVDFTEYTDSIPLEIAEIIINRLLDEGMARFGRNGLIRSVACFGYVPRKIFYPVNEGPDGPKFRLPLDNGGWQRRGPLMGEPATYTIGSFLHLFMVDLSAQLDWDSRLPTPLINFGGLDDEGLITADVDGLLGSMKKYNEDYLRTKSVGPQNRFLRTEFRMPYVSGLCVTNDDGIFPTSLKMHNQYKKVTGTIGLTFSNGSHFLSQYALVFCEDVAYGTGKGHWSQKDQLKTRHLARIHSNIRGGKYVEPALTRGDALQMMLRYHIQVPEEVDPHRSYYKTFAGLHNLIWGAWYVGVNRTIPTYLPTCVGGLGRLNPRGWSFVWRRRVPSMWKRIIRSLTLDRRRAIPIALILSGVRSMSWKGHDIDALWWPKFASSVNTGPEGPVFAMCDVVNLERSEDLLREKPRYTEDYFENYHGDTGLGWENRRFFLRGIRTQYFPFGEVIKRLDRGKGFSLLFQGPREPHRLKLSVYKKRVRQAVAEVFERFPPPSSQISHYVPLTDGSIGERISDLRRSLFVAVDGPLDEWSKEVQVGLRVGLTFEAITWSGHDIMTGLPNIKYDAPLEPDNNPDLVAEIILARQRLLYPPNGGERDLAALLASFEDVHHEPW
jgi:hypothetical protein